jgi:phosphoribosylaminoimidazole-succinocarboxamide synthase
MAAGVPLPTVARTDLPLPLVRRGKVRDVYAVGDDRLLLVASDRVSAFDVVMAEPIPAKGIVLTQLSAWWFARVAALVPHHLLTADVDAIVAAVPVLAPHRDVLPVECVVRGYLSGSAWKEYQAAGTLAGEPLPAGLRESDRLEPALFSPATKAETGHDENITRATMAAVVGAEAAEALEGLSRAVYALGRDTAAGRGIIVADTKFEFGWQDGRLMLIDEVLTPDSSRFWPADQYVPGRGQPSFDKQPLRDWLDVERRAGRWNGEAPPPPLPDAVVDATSRRYRDAYARITGSPLPLASLGFLEMSA